jgi:hypothetical protein
MPTRTDLTPKQLANQNLVVTAASADVTFVAADNTNGNQVDCTGKELLLVYNSAGSAGTVTISGKPDEFGRTGNIATYSVATLVTSIFGPFSTDAFRQTAAPVGKLLIDTSASTMKLAVLRLP